LFGIAATLSVLSAINIVLLFVMKVKGRGYFYFNAVLQLILFFLVAGLLSHLGISFFILNLAIIFTLREKRKPPDRTTSQTS
jgi:hypothetical protein